MSSFGATNVAMSGFIITFQIQEQVYHLICSFFPPLINKSMYFIGDEQSEEDHGCVLITFPLNANHRNIFAYCPNLVFDRRSLFQCTKQSQFSIAVW